MNAGGETHSVHNRTSLGYAAVLLLLLLGASIAESQEVAGSFGISAAIGQITYAQAPPKAPWGLEPQSTIPISVPADIRQAVGFDLEYEEAEPIKGVAVDLNGDGIRDYLLQSAPSLCGSGGCVYVLCDGATRKKVGQFLGGPLIVRLERVHGYPNIETYNHQSADSGIYTKYSFAGSAYVVTSRRNVEGAAVDPLLETLHRVPIWRGFVPASALNVGQSPVTQGPDFRGARELKVLTVVIDESNHLRAPRVFPDAPHLLLVLAKAQPSITNDLALLATSSSIQMGIDLDGSQWLVNLPLPLPGSPRPYRFYVSGRRANEIGIPIYTLSSRDAEPLGVMVNALMAQKALE